MKRLTHKTGMGWDDWEEVLYSVPYGLEGVYNILDLANEYGLEGQEECFEILKSISVKLAAYEDTGLEPEDVVTAKSLAIQYLRQAIAENEVSIQLGQKEGIDVTCICEGSKGLEKVLLRLAADYQEN